jgi:hypothetical protein
MKFAHVFKIPHSVVHLLTYGMTLSHLQLWSNTEQSLTVGWISFSLDPGTTSRQMLSTKFAHVFKIPQSVVHLLTYAMLLLHLQLWSNNAIFDGGVG